MSDPLVSIICNAYNHGPYIRQTLEGFLMQETAFPYEILVHDDASTDDTASVIRELAEQHPDLIKPIYQTENQYSKHIGINRTYQYPRVRGQYIALCEGDDFWTDPRKLQKQVEAMERHPEVSMCGHASMRLNSDGREIQVSWGDRETIITPEEIIAGGGLSLNTCSLMFRSSMLNTKWRFRQFMGYDYTMKIQGALQGGILYLPDNMATYRYLSGPDAWTMRMRRDNEKKVAYVKNRIQMLDYLNEDTEFRYEGVIKEKKQELEWDLNWFEGNFRVLVRPEYASHLKRRPLQKRALIRLGCVFPGLALRLRYVIYRARLKRNA